MRRVVFLCAFCTLLMLFSGAAIKAQPPINASPTPFAVTATPIPQVMVVTATPSAPIPPQTFWDENGKAIVGALIGMIFTVLVVFLKPIVEKLGNMLTETLSKFSSGWWFEKNYLNHLIEEHRGLNIRGLKTRAPVTIELEKVYVSLHTQLPDTVSNHKELMALSVGQAMAQHERLAILGGPGTGKTTLLAYLALTYLRGQTKERLGFQERKLPIFIPLRQLKKALNSADGATTLPTYLTAWYTGLGLRPRKDFFENVLRKGRCLVMLDGLDEVADEAERQRVSEWVDQTVTIYPQNRYVVTSRPVGYESAPLENGFTVLNICDFTAKEIRLFATNWCLAVEFAAQGEDNTTARRRAQDAAHDLVKAIEAHPAIRKLAVNPLLLSIIALVHRYRATLPKRRVDLYAECVDVLLGHWDEAKGLMGRLSPGEKRAVLQPLALKMHLENQRDIHRRELEARIAELLPAVGGQATDATNFVDEVCERSGLLVETGLGMYAFSHMTFQEYLCARELVDNERVRGLSLTKVSDQWWQEVILLYVGIAEATAIINTLLAVEDGETMTNLLLAGRCVAEAIRMEEGTRERTIHLLTEAFSASIGDQFVEIGRVLADIAGEDIVDFFLRLAHDRPEQREAALWSLGQISRLSDEVTRERVVEQLVTRFQSSALQQEAGTALVEVWGAKVVTELNKRRLPLAHLRQVAEILARTHCQLLLDALLSEETVALRELLAGVLENMSDRALLDLLIGQQNAATWTILGDVLDRRMIEIPDEDFLMGYEKRKRHVDAFEIDKYPVTNVQYKRFLDAVPGHPVPFVDADWARPYNWDQQSRIFPSDKARHPVVLVTWHDAITYAKWANKRLPTEEEWEKAARGTDGRLYSWGDQQPTRDLCNFGGNEEGTTPVGKYSPQGDSPYGCVDMAGNVWEWTASDYSEDYKVVRGGGWYRAWNDVRTISRTRSEPRYCLSYIGFRCARTLKE